MFSLVVPIGYCIFWFCVWGGIGLRQSRQALELLVLGQTYFNNSAHFLVDGSEVCFNVPQDDIQVDGEAIFTNFLPGVTPVCMMDAVNYRAVPFNVLNSFTFPDTFGGNGLGNFLCFLFLFCCSIFFVAVADSSTFVVDCIASNGRKNFHWSRRLIWACTTGVQASLIISSRTEPVTVLKPIIFLCCFPLTILIAYLAQSIVLLCEAAEKIEADDEEEEAEYLFPNQPEFGMPIYGGVFNTMEYVLSFGRVNPARVEKQMHRASTAQIVEFIKGLVVPFISLNQILSKAYPQNPKTNTALVACYGVCYTAFVSVSIASVSAYPGLLGMAWTLLLVTGIQLAVVRSGFRSLYNVRSNYMADVTCSLLFWPQVLSQMRLFDESVATATGSVTVRLKQQENLKMLGIEEEVEEDDNEWTDATKNNKKVRDGKDLSKNDKYDDTGSSMLEV